MAWSTRACGPTRSPWNGRTISSPMAANITTTQLEADARHAKRAARRSSNTRPTSTNTGRSARRASASTRPSTSMAQGKAYSYITYNFFRAADRRSGQVGGGRQGRDHAGARSDAGSGGSLNGAWGWAIPKSSPNPDAAWTFLKWVESHGDRQEARAAGRLADPHRRVRRPRGAIAKYPYCPGAEADAADQPQFPGLHLHAAVRRGARARAALAVAGEKTPEDALAQVETEFDELAKRTAS